MVSKPRILQPIKSTSSLEWAWAFARVGVVATMALGVWFYMPDDSMQRPVLWALAFVLVYNVLVIGMIHLGKVQMAFVVGFLLDHLFLASVWWATNAFGSHDASNDLYLILFPIVMVGVIRVGWPYGLAYSFLFVGTIGLLEWGYEPAGSYAAEQLPLRIGFLGLVAVLSAVLVYHLQRAKRDAENRSETMDAIQRSMTEGLVVVDEYGLIVFCNPTATALLAPNSELVGRCMEGLTGFDGSHERRGIIGSVKEMALGRATVDTLYVSDDASQSFHYALTTFPIEMGGRLVTGVLIRDITEQWELEQLQYRFVSIAAHELRTPLTSVMGFSELLQTRQMSEEQRTKWTGYINAEAHRLTAILDQLLNVARIKSGETEPLEMGTMDTSSMVAQAVAEAGAADRTLTFDVDRGLPVVITDVGKVKQVLVNLLSNAVKYSPNDAEVQIVVRKDSDEERLVFDVTDRGLGIAERDRHRLFASFSRVPRPGEEIVRGAGLGLFISRRLARSLGGDVWLERSEPGVGSTFSFSIPLNGGAFAAAA